MKKAQNCRVWEPFWNHFARFYDDFQRRNRDETETKQDAHAHMHGRLSKANITCAGKQHLPKMARPVIRATEASQYIDR